MPTIVKGMGKFVGQDGTTFNPSPKKVNKKKAKKRKAKPETVEVIPAKKIQLSNGFTVEACAKTKPSLSNNPPNTPIDKKKQGPKKTIKEDETLNLSMTLQDMAAWSQFQIPEEILKALAEQGFEKPTKIQELTLPAAMLGRRDILGAAETGSGKTLAFGIPILAGIMKLKEQEQQGIDVYELPYKKSSNKNKVEEAPKVEAKSKKHKPKANYGNVSKKDSEAENSDDESDDDGHDSDVEGENSDAGEQSDDQNSGADNEDIDSNASVAGSENGDDPNTEFLGEYFVPMRKRKADENDGMDDDDDDGYVHLSEMDNFDEDDEETDSQDETADGDGEYDENFIGCVKVIDDIELPGAETAKTGKPLYALILTPTRELAMQITKHLTSAAKYTGIRIATLVGGMAAVKQERVLSKGPEIVVATPGRLWELKRQGDPHLAQLEHIKFLAIDETDRMVERNHFEELHPLLEQLNADEARRTSRQNFVFSATLTMVHDLPSHMKGKKVTKRGKIINRKIKKMTPEQKVKKIIDLIGITEPKVVDITSQNLGTAETLTECRIACSLEEKDYYLYYILKRHPGRTIVFCNSIGCVRRLAQLFTLLNCCPLPLHASMPQRQRLKNLERFRDNPHGVLVATDVAARGLDIPNVDHVIHYQVPRTAENYVHRSGRTARANKEGLTILMMEPGEAFLYTKLCRTLNRQTELPTFPVPSHILQSLKEIVGLARDVDRLQLANRRSAQEQGWLEKAAKEMDIVIDEDFVPLKHKDTNVSKQLQMKKKQLDQYMNKPIFPKGFSFKYPTLNAPDALVLKSDENALQVMKKAIETGQIKKNKRAGKNEALLKIEKKSTKPKLKKQKKNKRKSSKPKETS